jgi:hypothetical protein
MRRTTPTLIRPDVPGPDTAADELHRAGFSCQNQATYIYDANGNGRWCIDCEAPLGRTGEPTKRYGWIAMILFILVMVLAIALGLHWSAVDHPGLRVTPSPTAQPAVDGPR